MISVPDNEPQPASISSSDSPCELTIGDYNVRLPLPRLTLTLTSVLGREHDAPLAPHPEDRGPHRELPELARYCVRTRDLGRLGRGGQWCCQREQDLDRPCEGYCARQRRRRVRVRQYPAGR